MKKKLITLSFMLIWVSLLKAENNLNHNSDTTKIKLNNTKILVISSEELDSAEVYGEDWTEINTNDKKKDAEVKNWGGVDFGFNALITGGNNLVQNPDYLKLNYSRSFNWSINFAEQSIRLYKEHIKLTTGLGFQFYNYEFENNYTLQKGANQIIALPDTSISFDKNRLKSSFINVPLLLSFNTSSNPKKGFHFSAGIIAGYKMGSRLKQKYEVNNETVKPVVKSNFNLNPFQLVPTARIGFRSLNFFANYNTTPLFLNNEGPKVYPVSFGLSFVFND